MRTLFIPMFGDFSDATRIETNRWFDLDHVPQRLTCPGFLRAERYELVDGVVPGPSVEAPLRYLNVYYIEDPSVLTSDAYRRQVSARTPWSARRAGTGGFSGTVLRGVWRKQEDAVPARWGYLAPSEGARTWLVRMQNDVAADEDLVGTLSCPGVLGAERYESVEVEMPGPAAAAPPRFMAIYELESPEAISHPEFAAGHARPAFWQGVYRQRPSPWTLRPVASR
jgi:hypothetical protein